MNFRLVTSFCLASAVLGTSLSLAQQPGVKRPIHVGGPYPTTGYDDSTEPLLKTNAERELFAAVNEYRAKKGFAALAADPVLMKMARERSKRIDSRRANSHDDWNHHAFGMWPNEHAAHLGFGGSATENLGMGYDNGHDAVRGWTTSDGHNRQMLGQWKMNGQWVDMGFNLCGVATNGKNYILVVGVKNKK
jgi:uncharacterized protein YkwD